MSGDTLRKIFLWSLLPGIAVFVLIYRYIDPMLPWMPKCPLYYLTGLKCPGCGTQRALHSLFSGDLSSAWHYNPALLCALPILLLLIFAALRRRQNPGFYSKMNSAAMALTCGILLISWGILRNFLNL